LFGAIILLLAVIVIAPAAGVVIDSAAPGRTVCEPLLSCASWEAKAAAAEAMG